MTDKMAPLPELRLILAAQTSGLPANLRDTQFVKMHENQILQTLEQAGLWLGPRRVLEETEHYRQIIPYIVIRLGSQFIRYTRTLAGGEARLHGRESIGLGGHVDLSDISSHEDRIDLFTTLNRAAERELFEELGALSSVSKEWIGLILDNKSHVGRVHIGIVGLWEIDTLPLGSTDDAIGDISLMSAEDLRQYSDQLESWSKIILPWVSELSTQS